MKYVYPAIFHKDADGIWVEFPDLEGCFSDGENMASAMLNAEESLAAYLLTLREDGTDFPLPSDISQIKLHKNCYTSMVSCSLVEKSVKKTLTIPERLNMQAMAAGINFSQVLQEALSQKLATAYKL